MGRSTIHLLQILEEMTSKGIRLIATTQNIDTSTPMGKTLGRPKGSKDKKYGKKSGYYKKYWK